MNAPPAPILLVEDNPAHAALAKRAFGKYPAPIPLTHVEDGETALDYLFGQGHFSDRSSYPAPSLVLLDLRLPRIDGLEVLRTSKQNPLTSRIPIVVLTTSHAESDVEAANNLGADNYLVKPLDLEKIARLMRTLGVGETHPEAHSADDSTTE